MHSDNIRKTNHIFLFWVLPFVFVTAIGFQITEITNTSLPLNARQIVIQPNLVTTWSHRYGGTSNESARAVLSIDNGEYIFGGTFGSSSGWLVKVNSLGDIVWQKKYTDSGYLSFNVNSIAKASDGGYVLGGLGTIADNLNSYPRGWVAKVDQSGNLVWQTILGNNIGNQIYSIAPTNDGGYVALSSEGTAGAGGIDTVVIKLDSSGTVTWQKLIGGSYDDVGSYILSVSDGGYLVTGYSSDPNKFQELWVAKLDNTGSIIWQRSFGGNNSDVGRASIETNNGEYLVAGDTSSYGAGNSDVFLLRLSTNGSLIWQKTFGSADDEIVTSLVKTDDNNLVISGWGGGYGILMKFDPNGNNVWYRHYDGIALREAYSVAQTTDGGFIIVGDTAYSNIRRYDAGIVKTDAYGKLLNTCPITYDINGTQSSTNLSAQTPAMTSQNFNITPIVGKAVISTTEADYVQLCDLFSATETATPISSNTPTSNNTTSTATPTLTSTQTATPSPTQTPTSTRVMCVARPAKPILQSPPNHKKLSRSNVRIDWGDSSCSDSYNILVRAGSQFGPKVASISGLNISEYLLKGLARGKTFYWQVKSCNSLGCTKSKWWDFQIKP